MSLKLLADAAGGFWRYLRSIVFACGLAASFVDLVATDVEAKTPGSHYCHKRVCHRVKTLAETEASIGRTEHIVASFYDDPKRDRFNPSNTTSSGETCRPGAADNAASPIYPDGTKLLVWNPVTRQAAVIRVNNAGPYKGNRLLDLSRGAAEKLGFVHSGVAKVQVRVVQAPTWAEATYRRNRSYDPVPGAIGEFASLDHAFAGAAIAMGGTLPASVRIVAATYDAPFLAAGGLPTLPPEMGEVASTSSDASIALAEVPELGSARADATLPVQLARETPSQKLAASLTSEATVEAARHTTRAASETKMQRGKAAPIRVAANAAAPRQSIRAEPASQKPLRQKPKSRDADEDEPAVSSDGGWSARAVDGAP